MVRLGVSDQRGIQHFLHAICAPDDFSESIESWMELLARELHKVIPNLFATYREGIRANARALPRLVPRDVDTPAIRARWAKVADAHPLIQHFMRNGHDGTAKLSDIISSREFHRLPLYNEFYRLMPVEDVLAVQFTTRDSIDFGIGLHRDRPFSRRDRDVLEILRPHLACAYENAAAIADLRRRLQLLDRALEHASCAVVAVKRDGRIRLATGLALKWMEEYFASSGHDRLPEVLDLWLKHHDAALRDSLGIPAPRDPLVVNRPGKRLVVRMLSNGAESELLLEERRASLESASLAPLGLSRREAEVLLQVSEGKTNTEVAAILAISPRTVQTHLEHVFRHLGVSTRAAAVARAFQAGANAPARDY